MVDGLACHDDLSCHWPVSQRLGLSSCQVPGLIACGCDSSVAEMKLCFPLSQIAGMSVDFQTQPVIPASDCTSYTRKPDSAFPSPGQLALFKMRLETDSLLTDLCRLRSGSTNRKLVLFSFLGTLRIDLTGHSLVSVWKEETSTSHGTT